MCFTPPQEAASLHAVRSMAGRIGAAVLHSRYSGEDTTHNARAAFLDRFEREVDPDGVLSPEERSRRATQARRAHMLKLAMRSAQARRGRAGKAASDDGR